MSGTQVTLPPASGHVGMSDSKLSSKLSSKSNRPLRKDILAGFVSDDGAFSEGDSSFAHDSDSDTGSGPYSDSDSNSDSDSDLDAEPARFDAPSRKQSSPAPDLAALTVAMGGDPLTDDNLSDGDDVTSSGRTKRERRASKDLASIVESMSTGKKNAQSLSKKKKTGSKTGRKRARNRKSRADSPAELKESMRKDELDLLTQALAEDNTPSQRRSKRRTNPPKRYTQRKDVHKSVMKHYSTSRNMDDFINTLEKDLAEDPALSAFMDKANTVSSDEGYDTEELKRGRKRQKDGTFKNPSDTETDCTTDEGYSSDSSGSDSEQSVDSRGPAGSPKHRLATLA